MMCENFVKTDVFLMKRELLLCYTKLEFQKRGMPHESDAAP